jgi:Uma2 family endonuclease
VILVVQASAKSWTLEAFLQLPETKPASEYLDGQIIQKPVPQGKHSAIQTELSGFINRSLKAQQVARAFCELRCTFGGRSTVPDIAVFAWERLVRDKDGTIANTFEIAPNWTIEILSPEQSQTKVTKNILHWLRHGKQMGWLIDPAEETVFVYSPKQEIQVFDEPTMKLPILFEQLELSLGELFVWLRA